MTRTRNALVRLALLLALLAPARPLAAQQEAPAALIAAARAVSREIAALRDLPWRRPVDFQVSDRSTIRRYARDALEREMPAGQWDAYERLLRHCGLIPGDLDLQAFVLRLYTEQVAGYYDPVRKTFYLADWLPRLLQRAVVAHEATHALQDQHFDLAPWLSELPPTEDGSLARAAVVEGDAMAAMLAYLLVPTGRTLEELPDIGSLLARRDGALAQAAPTFDEAPPALQRLLLFPYVEGSRFVLAGFRRGGWDAVDGLYEEPPASTEQILHPERYFDRRDEPRPLDLPPGPAGGHLLTAGSWGELGTTLVLSSGLADSGAAAEAARDWDGDRYALYHHPSGRTGYAWSLIWDSPAAAERFATAYAQATVGRFPGSARVATGTGHFSFETTARSLDLRWDGERVEIRENW